MRAVAISFSFWLLITGPTYAAPVGAGVGMRTCAQFSLDYRTNSANADLVYNSWALGFMSAMNLALGATNQKGRDLQALWSEDKKSYLRDFCNKRPLSMYMDGVLEVFQTLPPERN
jgi:hypothetical protein